MTDAALATSVTFKLPPLPYDYGALAPTLSAETMRAHHDKHHAAYVKKLNKLIAEGKAQGETLEEIVRADYPKAAPEVFNNAGQAWNHGFFWECMCPRKTAPDDALAAAIDRDFGGLEALGEAFVKRGKGQFGSGWVWLVARGDELAVTTTHDAGTPITEDGVTPILTCDVWEHAYYLDYKQDRGAFLRKWFETLANWDFAGRQHAAASGSGEGWRYPPPQR